MSSVLLIIPEDLIASLENMKAQVTAFDRDVIQVAINEILELRKCQEERAKRWGEFHDWLEQLRW